MGGPDGKFWLEVMTYGQRSDRLERHFIEILVIISKGGSSLTLVSWRYSYPPSSVNPNVLVMYSFHVTLSLLFMSRSLNMASTSSSTVHFCILCRTQISNSASSTKPSLLISIRGTSILNEKKNNIFWEELIKDVLIMVKYYISHHVLMILTWLTAHQGHLLVTHWKRQVWCQNNYFMKQIKTSEIWKTQYALEYLHSCFYLLTKWYFSMIMSSVQHACHWLFSSWIGINPSKFIEE